MKVIIIGAGAIGAHLADLFSKIKQDITIIDEDEEKGTGLPEGEIQQQETMYNTWSKLSKQLAEKFAAERQERVSSITD